MSSFDPDAAASPESGVFGLPEEEDRAALVIVPVPFAATVSYGGGAEHGPEAILEASRQVDLYDLQFGRIYERGIHMRRPDPAIVAAHERARPLCLSLRRGAAVPAADRAAIDASGEVVNRYVGRATAELLDRGVVPAILGGDHSVPFGGIAEAARRNPGLGILQIDAHADLREAYEGHRWSHASIMHNVLDRLDGVSRLVQIGIRDFCEQELRAIESSDGRVVTHFEAHWRERLFAGEAFASLCDEAVAALPRAVWISFDIDGLDPSLCPGTGTPVPGGLSFAEMSCLLERLARSGRRVVGFDLVEVAPASGGGSWDANVGARVLYKLCGISLRSS